MTEEKKERKPKTPRQPEFILKGALALTLKEKVNLVKALKEDIAKQVDSAKQAASIAIETMNGL